MKKQMNDGTFEFGIYEVYYNEHGAVEGYTEHPLTPPCESAEALKHDLELMMRAFTKDTLLYQD